MLDHFHKPHHGKTLERIEGLEALSLHPGPAYTHMTSIWQHIFESLHHEGGVQVARALSGKPKDERTERFLHPTAINPARQRAVTIIAAITTPKNM